jgi:cytochrome d ubiquinol oxidase subunit II
MDGYHIGSEVLPNALSNPLAKIVNKETGLWFANYANCPMLWAIPSLAFVSGIVTILLSKIERPGLAFISSSLTLAAVILTAGVSMFPFLIPSSSVMNNSLTIWDASSSLATLKIMFWVTLIFLPIVITYTTWVFRILRGKITLEHIHQNDHTAY